MRVTSLSAGLVTSALVALSAPSFAQDRSGANLDATGTGTPGGATSFAVAQDLYAIGMASKDALTVLTAAKLAGSVGVTEGETAEIDAARVNMAAVDQLPLAKRKAAPVSPAAPAPVMKAPEGETGVGKIALFSATSEEDGAADGPVDAATMLAAAKELAGEDETLLGLIEDVEAEGARGRIGGAISRQSRLPAGMTDVWEVPFYGSSYAEIAVVGDGDSNLDVLVTDESGNTICFDVSWSDKVACDFVPAWNGYFYITVQNTGATRNSYYLLTN